MPDLTPGLYEALLTELLASNLPDDRSLYRLSAVDPAEAPSVLAQHLARLIEGVLAAPGLRDNPERQLALCNRLVQLISTQAGDSFQDQAVDPPSRQLLEVRTRPLTPLVRIESLPRPSVPLSQNALLTAARGEPILAAELAHELATADRVDLLCAFIKWSGIRVLLDEIRNARERGVPFRVITTTYIGATEVRALDALANAGAEIRVCYETGSTRLHAKAWLFERDTGFSTAYIGSSNLSHSALHDGLEWNVRLTQAASPALLQRFRAAFDTYWEDKTFEPYDREAVSVALQRSQPDLLTDLIPFDVQPYAFQWQMLYQLEVERQRHNRWRNLVVAATGTGKTVVSAFDYRRVREDWGEASLLFVAHRQEILRQSLTTFRNVLKDASFGELYVAGERPREGRHVFASIQSLEALGRRSLEEFSPTAFEVVIVDEFHHAMAPTYRRLLERLQPRLLLGLTATPERGDNQDIKKEWFGGHIAVDLRLWEALEQGLLCPFQYFGIADGVDLSQLPWRRGGYDRGELDNLYSNHDLRVTKVLEALREIVEDVGEMRALGFCVSIKHAQFMADRFRSAGIPALAVSGDSSPVERAEALRALRTRTVNVLFAVDLFNEGLDIPEIDTLLLLRPTESPVVFLQQLGRGLRRTEGKAGLTVLDFIGQQHRRFRFEDRFRSLLGVDRRDVRHEVEQGFPYLPAGCSIKLDRQSEQAVLDNLKQTIRHIRSQLVERLTEIGDVPLSEFMASSGFSLEDIYGGANPGWTVLRRQANFVQQSGPDEAMLQRALARMLHIDDPIRIDTYLRWLSRMIPPEVSQTPERELRLAHMLHFDLWAADRSAVSLQQSLARLWRNPNMVAELRELLHVLDGSAARLAPDAGLGPEIPLCLHARYSRNELLAALGESTAEHPTPWREGIRWIERYGMDIFLVTLNKSERHFSPSTRYRDYPISPRLFHWESQSTTRVASTAGQRYLSHAPGATRALLFVRQRREADTLGTAPFLFLGSAHYVSHQGDRPISIVWELEHEMPPDFFQAARVAA